MSIKRIITILVATTIISVPAIQIKQTISDIQHNQESAKQHQLQAAALKKKADLAFEAEQKRIAEEKAEAERVAAQKAAEEAAAAERAKTQVAQATPQTRPQTSSGGGCEQYRSLLSKYFPADQINNAMLTMQKESGCRSNAVSPTDDHGLMQINCRYHCSKVGGNVNALYDPETNIKLASQIYAGRGWTAWYAVQGILW